MVGISTSIQVPITEANIADGAVTVSKLGNLAVEEGKIANLAVTTGKIANTAVDVTKIANDAVETVKIKNANVTSAKLSTDHFRFIASTTLAATNSAITVTGMTTSSFTFLKIFVYAKKNNRSATNDGLYFRINADSGANYNYHNTNQIGSNNASGATSLDTGACIRDTGEDIICEMTISNLASYQHGAVGVVDGGNSTVNCSKFGGEWNNTAAITEISFFIATAVLEIGSIMAIYGVGE